jgi:hypothetical protein
MDQIVQGKIQDVYARDSTQRSGIRTLRRRCMLHQQRRFQLASGGDASICNVLHRFNCPYQIFAKPARATVSRRFSASTG